MATVTAGAPHFNYGTYEQALAMIGAKSEVRYADVEVSWAMIRQYCGLVEDANPTYWDVDYATSRHGGTIAPPGMLQVWLMRAQWKPGGVDPGPSLADSIPLPGDTLINVGTEAEFLRSVRVGDQLSVVDEVTAITPEKTTRLGRGHFITTVATYRNQRGEVVARNTNQLFRFTNHGGLTPRERQQAKPAGPTPHARARARALKA